MKTKKSAEKAVVANKKSTHLCELPGGLSQSGKELGVIKIHENVIIAIVRKVSASASGVIRLAGGSLFDNIADLVGSGKYERACKVKVDGNSVEIEVGLNIAYGSHVPSLAAKIQSAIIEEVEKLTNLRVKNVNVVIHELEAVKEE
jgi:uncharacterized alkaline shock family protein YloU